MVLTRWYSATILAGFLVLAGAPAIAEDEPAPSAPPTDSPAPAAVAPPEKPPWWGGRNMLFLQVGFGESSVDPINTSVATETGNYSENTYEIDDTMTGRIAVGWTLPEDRGQFLINFEGIKEESYKFDAVGEQAAVLGGTATSAPLEPIPWWHVSVRDGNLSSRQTPPVWDGTRTGPDCGEGCDRNGDGRATLDEVDYPTVEQEGTAAAPKSLGNDIRTYDFLYGREFGGRRIWGSWSAGARYFDYDGAVPVAAWLSVLSTPGQGYTDGLVYRPLTFSQDTSGFGPTGSLGINFGFLRRKLVLHAGARVSYVLTSLKTTSGDFVTLIDNSGGPFLTAPANLTQSVDKSVWHLQAKISAKYEILPGFNIIADYQNTGFQDALLFPTSLSIPDSANQANQGTVAVYGTRDIRVKTFMVGVSYQF